MALVRGTLAFLGPAQTTTLSEFQYVEVVPVVDDVATVVAAGPDDELSTEAFDVPSDIVEVRVVPDIERRLWPGSYVAHPVAFDQTSDEGVDVWAYGVVAGYSVADALCTLHVVSDKGPVRLPLVDAHSVIKVDPLTYVLQVGGGVNTTLLGPLELLRQLNDVVAACAKKKASGIPTTVREKLTVKFDGTAVIPLVKPATLQVAYVQRQHVVDFATAPRNKRPRDLYSDPSAPAKNSDQTASHRRRGACQASLDRRVTVARKPNGKARAGTSLRGGRNDDDSNENSAEDDEDNGTVDEEEESDNYIDYEDDEDTSNVRHMNRSLSKRRRLRSPSKSDDESCFSNSGSSSRQNGIVFRPSPADRRIHSAIVNFRHKGKNSQSLLQSIQQAPYVEFLATPAVLRALYSFGFGLGLSIMHCRRVLMSDEVAAEERGVNMWDFSSKHSLQPPPKANSYGDIISALSTLHKFAQEFFNTETADFIATARDFMISYNDHARSTSTMARLLVFCVNGKFSLFRNRLTTGGLIAAMEVSAQFTRSDDKLSALRDSQHLLAPSPAPNKQRSQFQERHQRAPKPAPSSFIPPSVFSKLAKASDGRRLCLKFLSVDGCKVAKCSRAHFRPASLSDEANVHITENWNGLDDQYHEL